VLKISVENNISPFFNYLMKARPDFMSKAMKSLGYNFMKDIRAGMRSGEPDGAPWKERLPAKVRRDIGGRASSIWWGKLSNALGYEYQDPGKVAIGWKSRSATFDADSLETGQTRAVTAKTRIRWSRRGHPLKWSTGYIKLPSRPLFIPMWKQLEPKIAPFIEGRLTDYLSGSMNNAAKSIGVLLK
jgi:hypothetical protein